MKTPLSNDVNSNSAIASALKALAGIIAVLAILPYFALYKLGSVTLGWARVFPGFSQTLSMAPGLIGIYLRRAFYQMVFPNCGSELWFSFGAIFTQPNCVIGRRVYIGHYCVLGEVTIGDDVLLASHVSITNGSQQHGTDRLDVPIRDQEGKWPRITIGSGSWIGERAVIMADVGKHCVIGAGAVVTKPLADFAVAVGVPAQVIRYRNDPNENS